MARIHPAPPSDDAGAASFDLSTDEGGLPLSLHARRARFALAQWYLARFEEDDVQRMTDKGTWESQMRQSRETFGLMGEDLPALHERFATLNEYERETLDDLRDRDVSIPDLIDYLRAETGFNAEGRPVRSDLAATLRKREFLAKSKRIEDSGRSAALAVGAMGMLAIGSWAVTSGLFPGLAEAAAPVTQWIKPAWEMATDLVHSAAGGGALLLSWKMWKEYQQVKSGAGRLDLGRDADFSDLPASLGAMNYARVNDQYESIPNTDRHLIRHLSPTEARMFLGGSDSTRLHILRANPPTAWAQVQSRMDQISFERGGWVKALARTAWSILSSPWHRDRNNARVPDLEARMANWRRFADLNRQHRKGHGPGALLQAPKAAP